MDPRLRGDDVAAIDFMVRAGFGGELIELAGLGVALDPFIEEARVEVLGTG